MKKKMRPLIFVLLFTIIFPNCVFANIHEITGDETTISGKSFVENTTQTLFESEIGPNLRKGYLTYHVQIT